MGRWFLTMLIVQTEIEQNETNGQRSSSQQYILNQIGERRHKQTDKMALD
jgi:hypothetical protein